MSVLMTLKYPISTPPTREQLEAIPFDVLEAWLREVKYNVGGRPAPITGDTPRDVSDALITTYEKQQHSEKTIEILNNVVKALKDRIYALDEV